MERKVLYSDLSGEMIQGPQDHAIVTVTSHPELDQPVRLDARPGELERLGELSIEAVALQVELPDQELSYHLLPLAKFNELAGAGMEMEAILAGATPAIIAAAARRRNHNRRSDGGPLISYGDAQYAGMPHKGKVGDEEKRIVRGNLEEVNARLEAQGIRTIDPSNSEHAELYGFTLASETSDAAAQLIVGGDPAPDDKHAETTGQSADLTAQETASSGLDDDASSRRRRNPRR
jgi:hypothetical protein